MKKINAIALILTGSLVFGLLYNDNIHYASAHIKKNFGSIDVVVGWGTEPALAGQLNTVIVEITTASDSKPVLNAVSQLQATIKKGADTKSLDLLPQEQEGAYGAQVIPSQIGAYELVLNGTVSGQAVAGSIPLDTVADSKELNFPPGGSSSVDSGVIDQFKTAIADLTTQVDDAKASADQAVTAAKAAQDIKASADQAFMFGMIGVGIGVAGIALAVIALSRKEKVGERVSKF